MLEERGAVVIDADHLARLAIAPGTPGHERAIERFGEAILTVEGEVDRDALARVVFVDPAARADLEAIVHPEVGRLMQEALQPYRSTDRVVVYVVPLLVERGLEPAFDVVVTVRARPDVRVARLAADRGMPEADAR